jgi:hypothetical protein
MPAFKVLCYYGSRKERELKRRGWTKPDAFHICITSYQLAVQGMGALVLCFAFSLLLLGCSSGRDNLDCRILHERLLSLFWF